MTSNQSNVDDNTIEEMTAAEQVGYKQSLSRRHVQMIAIGGAIGSGLFLGSAKRLHDVGPALVISFAAAGLLAYFLMRSVGELVMHRRTSGAWVSYSREFYGQKAAYVVGWINWMQWAITGIVDLSAVASYVGKWIPQFPRAITVAIALVVVLSINLVSARLFGEFEFWASLLKVLALVLFIVVGLVWVIGGLHIGNHTAGLSNITADGGLWPHQWWLPITVLNSVIFSYSAIELLGITAGEMEDPEKEVPDAVHAVIYRIAIFYVGSLFLLAAMLPTSLYHGGTSPFVTVFSQLGVPWVADLVNTILIVAAISSINTGIYSNSRILRSLGDFKQAPKFTTVMSKSGVPIGGIFLTAGLFTLGVIINVFIPQEAFDITSEASGVVEIFVWGAIFLCQLKLRKLSDKGIIPPSKFKVPGAPWTTYLSLLALLVILILIAFGGKDNLLSLLVIPVYIVFATVGWFFLRRGVLEKTKGKLSSWYDDKT